MASDWVEITHKDSPDEPPAVVTREAYETVWSKKDPPWKLKGEAQAPVGDMRSAVGEPQAEVKPR